MGAICGRKTESGAEAEVDVGARIADGKKKLSDLELSTLTEKHGCLLALSQKS